MSATPRADLEAERLRALIDAIGRHGLTMWSDSSCGSGRPGGQVMTTEAHAEVIQHLVSAALAGRSLEQAADEWAALFPTAVRLDAPRPAWSGRRGPDGRPR
jgi:hypothetical protein